MPCRLNGDVHEWFNEIVTVPSWNPLKIFFPVQKPETPSGKLRPCGTLLQLVVVVLPGMHRISRSVEVVILVAMEQTCNTTHF